MECEEVLEASDAYAIGALDPSDRDAIERHLEICPACRDAVERAILAVAYLGLSTPLRRAPRELHARLMHQIAHEEASPEPATAVRHLRESEVAGHEPRATSLLAAPRWRSSRGWRWLQPVAAALAILLLGGSAFWITHVQMQVNKLQARSQALQRIVSDFEGQRAALMLLASDGTVRYEMQATNPNAGMAGAVIWNPNRHVCSIFVSGLPAPPPGQSYHVLLVGNSHSWDSGVLSDSGEGTAEKTLDLNTMSNESGYQVVVSLQQHQGTGDSWQPLLKAWVGIQ